MGVLRREHGAEFLDISPRSAGSIPAAATSVQPSANTRDIRRAGRSFADNTVDTLLRAAPYLGVNLKRSRLWEKP